MSDDNILLYEEHDHIGVITLNRPEAMNSLNYALYEQLEDTVRASKARVLVITGSGKAFCAGDDVKQVLGSNESAPESSRQREFNGMTPAAEAMLYSDIPIIAAVNGAAVGWGMELALMADIRVASEYAKFGSLFVVRGLCCDVAGLGRLAALVGRERAAELLYTGDVIDSQTALDIGLVSRRVAADALMDTAMELAGKIAHNPPLAVQALKAGLRQAAEPDWLETGRWAFEKIRHLRTTEDCKEGVAAFLEKREPVYKGR